MGVAGLAATKKEGRASPHGTGSGQRAALGADESCYPRRQESLLPARGCSRHIPWWATSVLGGMSHDVRCRLRGAVAGTC